MQYTAAAVKYRIAMMNDKLSDEINWSLGDRYNLSLPADRRSNKKKNFFYRDQLQGMQDIKRAWGLVSTETISNCYLHTSLLETLHDSSEVHLVAREESEVVMDDINDQLSIWGVGRCTEDDVLEDEEEEGRSLFEDENLLEEIDAVENDEEDSISEVLSNEMLIQAFQTVLHFSKVENEEDVAFMQAVKDRASNLVSQVAATKTKQSKIHNYFARQ